MTITRIASFILVTALISAPGCGQPASTTGGAGKVGDEQSDSTSPEDATDDKASPADDAAQTSQEGDEQGGFSLDVGGEGVDVEVGDKVDVEVGREGVNVDVDAGGPTDDSPAGAGGKGGG